MVAKLLEHLHRRLYGTQLPQIVHGSPYNAVINVQRVRIISPTIDISQRYPRVQ